MNLHLIGPNQLLPQILYQILAILYGTLISLGPSEISFENLVWWQILFSNYFKII